MSDFLADVAASSRQRAGETLSGSGARGLTSLASSAPPPRRLEFEGFGLIAEAKLKSPSQSRLAPTGDDAETVIDLARVFVEAGAAAVSVLTEPQHFGGDLSHLMGVAQAVEAPVMRKDFLVDPIQVVEARANGAAGVLLIARILSPAQLQEMVGTALSYGMFPLVELFGEGDLDVAESVLGEEILIGVNTRDLRTLQVVPQRLVELAPLLPDQVPAVAESGMIGPEDTAVAARLGYGMALVGSSLVRSPDPSTLISEMISAGREAAGIGVVP